jgi:hypothetical protein
MSRPTRDLLDHPHTPIPPSANGRRTASSDLSNQTSRHSSYQSHDQRSTPDMARGDLAHAQQFQAERSDSPWCERLHSSHCFVSPADPVDTRCVRRASRDGAMNSPVLGEALSGWDCLMYDTVDSNLVGRGSSVRDTYWMFTSTTELQQWSRWTESHPGVGVIMQCSTV